MITRETTYITICLHKSEIKKEKRGRRERRGRRRQRTYLLIDGVAITKYNIAPKQASKEGIDGALNTGIESTLNKKTELVKSDIFSKVEGMGLDGGKDASNGYAGRGPREKQRHDEGMGKADLCAINDSVASALEKSEGSMHVHDGGE